MPPYGHCAMFDWYQMAAWFAKMARAIGLKLRIQTHTEFSLLLSAEVVKIGLEDQLDVPS